jgi:hypothetical protein
MVIPNDWTKDAARPMTMPAAMESLLPSAASSMAANGRVHWTRVHCDTLTSDVDLFGSQTRHYILHCCLVYIELLVVLSELDSTDLESLLSRSVFTMALFKDSFGPWREDVVLSSGWGKDVRDIPELHDLFLTRNSREVG